MRHNFSFVEWRTTDLSETCRFLGGLFGWCFEHDRPGTAVFRTAEGSTGVVREIEKLEVGDSTLVFVEVDALDPSLERAVQLGGKVWQQREELAEAGWCAVVVGPAGCRVGLFQPRVPDSGEATGPGDR